MHDGEIAGISDAELLRRIAARDADAVSDLYDRHNRLLFGLILRIVRDRDEAEEVLQEVFLSVWTKAETYNATLAAPVAWLVRIARNRAIDRLRANNTRVRMLEPVQSAAAPARNLDDTPAPVDNPEVSAVRNEQQRSVARALEVLPPDQRELIEHAYFLGLTHSELAARFDLPLGTVKTRVRTALQTLRQQFVRA